MKKKHKGKIYVLVYFLILLLVVIMIKFIKGELVYYSKVTSYLDKTYNQSMSIKADTEFLYKGKVYRIIFSTPKENKNERYLQCFEEKFKGLVYKPTYGASQGKSRALYNMTNHFLNNSNNESFFVVYGYNKELKADNFSVRKTDNSEWISEDISNQEHFLYIYTNIEYGTVVFRDGDNYDITPMFYGQ